jgi:hypothetical protein
MKLMQLNEELDSLTHSSNNPNAMKQLRADCYFYYKLLKLINDTTALEKRFEIESIFEEVAGDLMAQKSGRILRESWL